MDCIFCKISAREIPSEIVFEDEDLLAFKDVHPQAPVHQLIIPKKHIATLDDVEDFSLLSQMMGIAQKLARTSGIAQSGYRVVMNCNPQGGQSVYHIHLHLLGGRQLGGSMVG